MVINPIGLWPEFLTRGVFTMSWSHIRGQRGLAGLIVDRFYLELKAAVSAELSEDRTLGWGFDINKIEEVVVALNTDGEMDSTDRLHASHWCKLRDGVRRRLGVPNSWMFGKDASSLSEFDLLVIDALEELRSSSTVVDRE
jgi:hypothetical protein